mmetsp:Transcript_16772/g.48168  ORF Transcript_16772/g.48168 Transcript_16772/m.48168 type:complete len:299 (+) Transcript_16772:1475-2371(+)
MDIHRNRGDAKALTDRNTSIRRNAPHSNTRSPASSNGQVAVLGDRIQGLTFDAFRDFRGAALDDKVMKVLRLTHEGLAVHNVNNIPNVFGNVEHEVNVGCRLSGNRILLDPELERTLPFARIEGCDFGRRSIVAVLLVGIRGRSHVGSVAAGTLVCSRRDVIGVAGVGRNVTQRVLRVATPAKRQHSGHPRAAGIAELFAVGKSVAVAVGLAKVGRPLVVGRPPVQPKGVEVGIARHATGARSMAKAAAVSADAGRIVLVEAGHSLAVGDLGTKRRERLNTKAKACEGEDGDSDGGSV